MGKVLCNYSLKNQVFLLMDSMPVCDFNFAVHFRHGQVLGVERKFISPLSIHLGYPHSPDSVLLSRFLNSSVVLTYILFIWQLFLLGHWTSVSCSIIPQQYLSQWSLMIFPETELSNHLTIAHNNDQVYGKDELMIVPQGNHLRSISIVLTIKFALLL